MIFIRFTLLAYRYIFLDLQKDQALCYHLAFCQRIFCGDPSSKEKILGRALEDGQALDMFIVSKPLAHNSENRAKLSKKVQTCENLMMFRNEPLNWEK